MEPAAAPDLARLVHDLHLLIDQPDLLERAGAQGKQVIEAAARLLEALRRRERRSVRQRDRDLRSAAGIRGGPVPSPESTEAKLHSPRRCYVCGRPYTRRHPFYDRLCPDCGEESFRHRGESADLSGRFALVTGGRVRIGFRVALKLLRAGAHVTVVTRFPHDAADRFAAETDAATWADRLRLCGLDLRALPLVERFTSDLATRLPHLDILINNAAQTVRRPPEAYRPLLERERQGPANLPALAQSWPQPQSTTAAPTTLPLLGETPVDAADGLPVDVRPVNSWDLTLDEVSLHELVEVQLVNSLAPFVLLQRLTPVLARSPHPLRFVVNVASREGQFDVGRDGRHPHTNMAKAALNMLTRTCAADLARQGILVNSVVPGWVSHQAVRDRVRQLEEQEVRPALDAEDGAARVCAPIFAVLQTGQPIWGKLFKDYRFAAW
jgi:NAD(P)-dependent dehydrogenase (short-subunit alcohol dehydrogenase family)